jgi:hypothetical protein
MTDGGNRNCGQKFNPLGRSYLKPIQLEGGVTMPGMRGYHKTVWGVTMVRYQHSLVRPMERQGRGRISIGLLLLGRHGCDYGKTGTSFSGPAHRFTAIYSAIILEPDLARFIETFSRNTIPVLTNSRQFLQNSSNSCVTLRK